VPSDIVCFFLLYTISSGKGRSKKGKGKKESNLKQERKLICLWNDKSSVKYHMGLNKAIIEEVEKKRKHTKNQEGRGEKGFEILLKLSVKIQIIICRLYERKRRKQASSKDQH
jgi:hypothetical protein